MIIIYDVETCGLYPKGSHYTTHFKDYPNIVSLAFMVCNEDGKELERYSEIVSPTGYEIPEESTKIHGITTEKALFEGRPIKEVLKYFILAASKCERLVGHNIYFDTSIIKASFLRLGIAPDLINPVLDKAKRTCTMQKSTKFCNLPGKYGNKWPKLEELYKILFNKEMENCHDAMADVIATKECYFELKRLKVL